MARGSDIPEIIQVQLYIEKKWDFRYNVVLGRIEFKTKHQIDFRVLNDYDLNSIHKDYSENMIDYSVEKLRKLLISSFSPRYNPFYQYFNDLPIWDGTTDYIDMLASTVKTTNDDFFRLVFKKWIVAMVGSLLDDKVINHTFLILTGGQGVGKTTWINNLVPPELHEYYYSGAINPNNSDSKIQLGENMLINIDELQGMTSKGLEDLKALITIRDIKVRRPYAAVHEIIPHRASFAGSVNVPTFLNDTTGNRRFLCFEVTEIEYEHNIPIELIYAQALSLFKNGFKFYLDREEIVRLNEHNEAFVQRTLEDELMTKYITPCSRDDKDAIIGTTTDIAMTLSTFENKLRVNDTTLQRIGKLLKKKDYERFKKNGNWVYSYKIIYEPQYGYYSED
ncbi:MAG: virulence-associated E family protein [Prevotella sp.]|jgi:predicted P-loop ATPase|nr:virulence-associated E family protein [Prevotella sp.]